MKDPGKFVHDNEFCSNKACKEVLSVPGKNGEKLFEEMMCMCFFPLSILFSLMHLTLCDKVNVILDEFTGHVRALVTCAT